MRMKPPDMKYSAIRVTASSVAVTPDSVAFNGSTSCAMVEPRCRSISSPATSAAQKGMPNSRPISTPTRNSLISRPVSQAPLKSCKPVKASNVGSSMGTEMAMAVQLRTIPVRPRRLNAGVTTTTPIARDAASAVELMTGYAISRIPLTIEASSIGQRVQAAKLSST